MKTSNSILKIIMNNKNLKKDMKWFNNNLPKLLSESKDRWCVVYKEKMIGLYGSFEEAYEQGVIETDSEHILVKKITDKDTPIEPSVNITLGLFHYVDI